MSLLDDIVRDVAELPDRNSPEGQPDMMLVTVAELQEILERNLSQYVRGTPSLPHELRDLIEGMSVSVDVSTGEHDAGHRYSGTVTEVTGIQIECEECGCLCERSDDGTMTPVENGRIAELERRLDEKEAELAAIKEQKPVGTFIDEEYGEVGWWTPVPRGTDLYALPVAPADKDAERSGLEGFSIWFNREQWGAVIDGLMLERDRSIGRKKVNSESTSDARADMCAELVRAIGDASAASMPKGEPT